jgi:hypothetical protein
MAAARTATEAELIAALKLALPYVRKVAGTAPTTFTREMRRLQACKDVCAVEAAIAGAESVEA